MKTLVIIPAYNEEKNIRATVETLRRECPEADLVVVNDGSADRTGELCRAMGCDVLELSVNLGIGGCVQTGYRYALERGYDVAVQMDADGQHPPAFLPALLAPIAAGEADLVIGSRFLSGEGYQPTAARRVGIVFLSGLVRVLCGVRVYDVTSGMRAAGKKAIALFAEDYAQDYPEPESVLSAGMAGLRLREIGVKMAPRQGGESSITPWGGVYYMVKVSLSLILHRLIGRDGHA